MTVEDTGDPNEQKQAETSADQPALAEIDMQEVPSLPGGRNVFPAEREGKFVWLVREGAMTPECFAEMRGYLVQIASSGSWVQNWGGGPQLN
jgi:hypothetical protein